ncbi:threonine--tRNA ligase [Metallosphaera tengchongensis]|uniref:Threonine--tRNA ligase n=1 Tax=Metallosphaera tengchongensis TaxID=1532350 RepID=A0A6N0NRB7_9CREN|nr:threonine--tRNA ligase [Metallosphaera tengchongensis]QKQ99251.1 threonine--tRNA ligase [Metallosphaera tengchongensis]
MESYKGLWLKGAILMAINMSKAGLKPVEVGLGERDFYVDVESDSTITLDQAEKYARWDNSTYVVSNHKVLLDGTEISIKDDVNPSGDPRFFKVLNVSTHHPSAEIQLIRIRAVAFETEQQLQDYLEWLEKASEIDHRIIGERMDLFSFHDESGPGLVLFHPKGQLIRNEMINFMREINSSMGYQEVYTSHVFRTVLWKISGHYDTYRDKMLIFHKEEDELGIKPMNCPAHILIYKSRIRSYKDLPLRFSEFGNVYRWEKKGELYGLLRTRGFTQDDGHIFLREDQLKDEVKTLVTKTLEVLDRFGFRGDDVKINLSTRPDESIGSDEQWEKATSSLLRVLKELNVPFVVKEKEGAFYGPKIDFDIRDSLNRWWQLSTIQVDFNLPERFKLEYIDEDGSKKRPVIVHRAIYGSLDRMIAILLEHFRGKLPSWLSPVQVRVLPINEEVHEYAKNVESSLKAKGIRVELEPSGETLSKRVKRAYDDGVPYILIAGKKEASEGKVTVRARGNLEARNIQLERFIDALISEISERNSELTAIKRIQQ